MASPGTTGPLTERLPTLVVGGDPAARLALAQQLPGAVVVVGDDPAWLQAAEGAVSLVLSLPPGEALAAEVVVAAVVDRFGGLGCVVHLPPVLAEERTSRQWSRALELGVVALRAVDDAAAPHLGAGACVVYGELPAVSPEAVALNAARRGWAEARWTPQAVSVRFARAGALVSAASGAAPGTGLRGSLRARARALGRRVADRAGLPGAGSR